MRYFIGFLVTIGLIVLIIVLLLGGGSKKSATPAATKPISLIDYANSSDSSAQIIIDGPVIADQNHKMLKINVSRDQVVLTTYSGYQQNVTGGQTYPNNATSFAIFLKSLQNAGFTVHDTKIGRDERGVCPSGERYIFEFINAGSDLRRSWTTSCGTTSTGSFKGQFSTIQYLFRNQVPDYSKLTANTQLY